MLCYGVFHDEAGILVVVATTFGTGISSAHRRRPRRPNLPLGYLAILLSLLSFAGLGIMIYYVLTHLPVC